MKPLLLCADMDRTLIPNGNQTESPRAMERFRQLSDRQEVTLVYVTGRHRELIEQAIAEFGLPTHQKSKQTSASPFRRAL